VGWLFLVVGALIVFAIAAGTLGTAVFKLGHETPSAILDVQEAVELVAEDLPEEVQARVTYAEVRTLILAALDHLEAKGVSAPPGEDPRVIGERDEVVVDEQDAVAVVLGAVDRTGLEVSDEDAYEVIRALLAHLERIGALGPPA
jgi:hypothetical protein